MKDESYMQYALELAAQGVGKVNPNPMVGAVIVKNNEIIGQGYHEAYGGLHAERNALASCVQSPKGATMYVTLEPCCHYGKTPPCTKAIIESGISKVVVGTMDPNEKMAGKGIQILKDAGIEVIIGVLEQECRKINEVFFHYITQKTPFVVMKYAMTMDGKIATVSGQSQWITGEVARARVHQDRNRYTAIMVGVNTVLADDPQLTCRMENGRNPIRIICDTYLRTPLSSNVVTTADQVRTMIVTSNQEVKKHHPYLEKGCEILVIPRKEDHIDLQKLINRLGDMEIDSVFLEGGSTLNFSALTSGIVHKVYTYLAPKLFGGIDAKTPVGGRGITEITDAVHLKIGKILTLGEDILIESEVDSNCLPES